MRAHRHRICCLLQRDALPHWQVGVVGSRVGGNEMLHLQQRVGVVRAEHGLVRVEQRAASLNQQDLQLAPAAQLRQPPRAHAVLQAVLGGCTGRACLCSSLCSVCTAQPAQRNTRDGLQSGAAGARGRRGEGGGCSVGWQGTRMLLPRWAPCHLGERGQWMHQRRSTHADRGRAPRLQGGERG